MGMKTIEVAIPEQGKQYAARVGDGILDELPAYVAEKHAGKKIAVVADSSVEELFGGMLRGLLGGENATWLTVPAGEQSKSREQKAAIEDRLLEEGFGRDSLLIAIGGGMLGDLAGFVAATFMRGIPVIHVPTTLLAMVDSSIGGKTGINTMHGKNLIGAIHQPDAVYADLQFLSSLPPEEFSNGMAEVIKLAAARDKDFFRFLEQKLHEIQNRNWNDVEEMIARAITLKKEIAEQDERETGLRQVLNLSHTIGHAIEASTDYAVHHGRCVAQGLVAEARLSMMMGILPEEDCSRITELLREFGLPHTLADAGSTDRLIGFMKTDKKTRDGRPHTVLLERIGTVKREDGRFSFPVEEEILRKAIEESRHD